MNLKIQRYGILVLFSLLVLMACKKDGKKTETAVCTCSDGVLNQNETKVDCGGVCSVCQTCSDGIQNEGETGIDCGGPCGKCPIVYPDSAVYGKNLLGFRNYDTTLVPAYYSLAAKVPAGSKLKVTFSNLDGGTLNYGITTGVGNWQIFTDPQLKYQSFSVEGPVAADQQFVLGNPFFGATGVAKMEIFENDATRPTWVKILKWK